MNETADVAPVGRISQILPVPESPARQAAFSTKELRSVTYTPECRRGLGPAAWRQMVQELVDSRELIWRLYLRDFSARYRQSFLGYVWAIMPALATVLMFTGLNRSHVIPIQNTAIPYPAYVMLGMTVWLLFASGLSYATQSLVNAGGLITKINFPRETLVLAAFGQSLFETVIRAVMVVITLALFHVVPKWTIILVPFAMIPLCLLTVGLGYIFALINGVMRDAGQVVTFCLQFGMLLTPVVYPAPTHGAKALINVLNPVSPFVNAAQDLTALGHLSQPLYYVIGCGVSLLVFLLSWRLFHLTETRIAERV